jgi:hypothetical protein
LLTQLHWYDRESSVLRRYTAAVSIHSHTNRSRERLGFVERLFASNSLLRTFIHQQHRIARKRSGIEVHLDQAYWTPPLCPRSAYELEKDQIEQLGLVAIVSLSDHDSIEAPQLLRATNSDIPISFEWTAHFRSSKFHIGVHNLPAAHATRWMQDLQKCTASKSEARVRELLQALHAEREALIVFNHPLWNLNRNPAAEFARDLDQFLRLNVDATHAFELNGLRTWQENRRVSELASKWKKIVISGGDRHGCEPNANLNLTNASSFAEWVQEIRIGHRSHVLFMPQYRQSLASRCCKMFLDAIREYPNHGDGCAHWDQRVFHPGRNGPIQPLSEIWSEVPLPLRIILGSARLAESANLMDVMRLFGGRTGAERPARAESR